MTRTLAFSSLLDVLGMMDWCWCDGLTTGDSPSAAGSLVGGHVDGFSWFRNGRRTSNKGMSSSRRESPLMQKMERSKWAL